MENSLQMAANLIDLFLAIKDNNLEEAKNLVPILNNQLLENDNQIYVNEILGLNNLSTIPNNETLSYVLDNLSNIDDSNQIRWYLQTEDMIQDFTNLKINNVKIKNFIIEKMPVVSQYYEYSTLIRMIHLIQDYDLLLDLKGYLEINLANQEG